MVVLTDKSLAARANFQGVFLNPATLLSTELEKLKGFSSLPGRLEKILRSLSYAKF